MVTSSKCLAVSIIPAGSPSFMPHGRLMDGCPVTSMGEMLANTSPIDVTGHPSMSLPCGMNDGLPAGMMLTAKQFDEVTLYRAPSAFEKAGDWKSIRP